MGRSKVRQAGWVVSALRRVLLVTAALSAFGLAAMPAQANDWIAAIGDWFTPGNWNSGIPTAADDAIVGNGGTAQVRNGGDAKSGAGQISGGGAVTVDGAGSTWTNSSVLTVGLWGAGTLDITAGGAVSSADSYLGGDAGSSGSITVAGAGSTWIKTASMWGSVAPGRSPSPGAPRSPLAVGF